ncbi:JHP726-like protein [Propionibacterium freudenreichii]|uniref:restriction endonuclease subunit S n=1 Tax=Propionibacterium freudenreichii TaxID=1744 RepID=UPI0005A5CB0E|nr:restriction endonuclease subunit S [Propionibacterium freudenreichii]MDK9676022.1 restriction endonuclease subunit S [Propionibacterium freudenreichii]CEI46616.1 JHP726-like protein [Propionibacterium freudenreichii]SCQ45610.1 Type I restriction-modification methylase [Propionibacterium freudenreichii]SCQ50194.1 Type I restriction-modification methylase [Propionibacterium freudenreichii]
MSRIDELTQELCPDGVERRPLGEFATLVRGNGMPKTDLVEEGVGAVHYGQIYTRYGVSATETFSFVSPEKAVKLAKVEPGDVIITNTSENIDDVGKSLAWVGDAVIVTGGHATVIKHDQDSKFLAYWFASADFYAQKRKLATGTKVIDVSAKQLATVRIPVPPLEVQREIVRVLDKFTQLEAELEAELEARRAQYEHYRNALLMSSDERGVRNVSLGDIIRLNFGVRITKKNDSGALYPVYGGGGESFRTDAFNREDEWVVSRFAMSANCVRRVDGKFWMLDSGFTFDVIDDAVDKDFVGQLLLSMQSIIFATSTQSAQKNIDVNGFKRLQVQFPSLATQQRVAASLANFDRIVNDLSIGLPAELAARRKQYEHYRDRLLTFKELAA